MTLHYFLVVSPKRLGVECTTFAFNTTFNHINNNQLSSITKQYIHTYVTQKYCNPLSMFLYRLFLNETVSSTQ